MKKFVFLCIIALNFCSLQTSPRKTPYLYIETMQLPSLDKKNWKCAYKAASFDGQSIVKWIRKGHSLNNFSEMITIEFFATSSKEQRKKTAIGFMQAFHRKLQEKHPSLEWEVIKNHENDVIFEWHLTKEESQYELVRLVCSKIGLHKIAYTKKMKERNFQDYSTWVECLKEAKLKKSW